MKQQGIMVYFNKEDKSSDGIQGVCTGSREPVLGSLSKFSETVLNLRLSLYNDETCC